MWFNEAELDECVCVADACTRTRCTLHMTEGALSFLKGYIQNGLCANKNLTFSYKGHPIFIDDSINSDYVIILPSSQPGDTIYYSWRRVR